MKNALRVTRESSAGEKSWSVRAYACVFETFEPTVGVFWCRECVCF